MLNRNVLPNIRIRIGSDIPSTTICLKNKSRRTMQLIVKLNLFPPFLLLCQEVKCSTAPLMSDCQYRYLRSICVFLILVSFVLSNCPPIHNYALITHRSIVVRPRQRLSQLSSSCSLHSIKKNIGSGYSRNRKFLLQSKN